MLSNNDFVLSTNDVFPNNEIYGYNIYLQETCTLPLHISEISSYSYNEGEGIEYETYTITLVDNLSNVVATGSCSISKLNPYAPLYTFNFYSDEGVFVGNMDVTNVFMSWLKGLQNTTTLSIGEITLELNTCSVVQCIDNNNVSANGNTTYSLNTENPFVFVKVDNTLYVHALPSALEDSSSNSETVLYPATSLKVQGDYVTGSLDSGEYISMNLTKYFEGRHMILRAGKGISNVSWDKGTLTLTRDTETY